MSRLSLIFEYIDGRVVIARWLLFLRFYVRACLAWRGLVMRTLGDYWKTF